MPRCYVCEKEVEEEPLAACDECLKEALGPHASLARSMARLMEKATDLATQALSGRR